MTGRQQSWWPRAALRRDEDFDEERKVTWLELFFDLVFVVVVARLAHDLASHVTASGLANFLIQFAAVFWAWNAFTYYIERFESGGLENRVFVFAAMAAVAALAVWTEGGLEVHYTGFALAYVLTRIVNMAQWVRAAAHVPSFRPIARRFLAGFGVTVGLIATAGLLEEGARRIVFAVAIVIDIATPAFTLRQQASLPQLSTSKFPERFGLFTMIVLGESIVGVITGISELNEAGELGTEQMVDGALALGIGIGLWWLYFDFVARRPPQPRIGTALAWVYLHLATVAAITATGAAISVGITESVGAELSDATRLLLGGAISASLLGITGLELTLYRSEMEPTHATLSPATKGVLAVLIASTAWVADGVDLTALLAVFVVALAIPAGYGATVWYSPSNMMRPQDRHRITERE